MESHLGKDCSMPFIFRLKCLAKLDFILDSAIDKEYNEIAASKLCVK